MSHQPIWRVDAEPHAVPIPAEPSDHAADPCMRHWRNVAQAVWEERNPGRSFRDAAAYPVLTEAGGTGWLSLRAQTGLLAAAFLLSTRKSGLRGTHPAGAGARGILRIRPSLGIPDHRFFRPGATYPCRLRHANGSFFDDASTTVRGCSLKLADSDFESPLDLMMNSGSQGPLWSTASFLRYTRARMKCNPADGDFEAKAALMDSAPAYMVAWNEAAREAPSCFSDLTYYSRVVFPFIGLDGVLRGIRFRLRRPDLDREAGMLTEDRQRRPWDMRRQAEDDRPLDYARAAFLSRVAGTGIRYVLQAQVRDFGPDDTTEVFHMNRPWSADRCPFSDLADIELTEPLHEQVTERMRFSEGHMPPDMGIFHAPSASDYRSIGWSRLWLYRASQLGRRRGPMSPTPAPYA